MSKNQKKRVDQYTESIDDKLDISLFEEFKTSEFYKSNTNWINLGSVTTYNSALAGAPYFSYINWGAFRITKINGSFKSDVNGWNNICTVPTNINMEYITYFVIDPWVGIIYHIIGYNGTTRELRIFAQSICHTFEIYLFNFIRN